MQVDETQGMKATSPFQEANEQVTQEEGPREEMVSSR